MLSDQCKEIEENNRLRKTRDLFNKIRDIKGTFHGRMGTVKDRNGNDLTEVEEIKKWEEYREIYNNGILSYIQVGGKILYRTSDVQRTIMSGFKEAYRLRDSG